MQSISLTQVLPEESADAILVGRIWDTESGGPRVVSVRDGRLHDLTPLTPTVSALLESDNPAELANDSRGRPRWELTDVLAASLDRDESRPRLLAPVDLQVIKACGVTFVESMIERVIEERCAGDPGRAREVRALVEASLGGSIRSLQPGSAEARKAKEVLTSQGIWSQYLEVGIGPDPEIFTKAPVLSSVGFGARVGIPDFSSWNNPEPELVLVLDSARRLRGACLGNDVNLRDVEGRSALLLGMAKDNNASCAVGPFIRLFDETFTIDSLRDEEINLTVEGMDGYVLHGSNSLSRISRPFEELIGAAAGTHHQYPDGFILFTGTLFAPTQDRDAPGLGFTHKPGDTVTIASPRLGALINTVGPTGQLPPWSFGIRSLFAYLQGAASTPAIVP